MQVGLFCHQLTALIFCAAGFVAAMNKAILQQDYIAYAYICTGAIECGIPNVAPSAFANVSLAAVLVLTLSMLVAIFSVECHLQMCLML